MNSTSRRVSGSALARAAAAALTLILAACGGGGGDSSPGNPPPADASLTLTGTAATGAVIAGGSVEAVCAVGAGTATTTASGSYSLTIASGSLPCALRVAAGDGTMLHSVVEGAAGTAAATANLSPLTELVVAQAFGTSPSTFFAEFATRQAAVTAAVLSAAVADLQSTLAGVGIDLAGANPLTAALAAGNAQDLQLDALQAQLASAGTTLAALGETVANSSPAAAPEALNPTPSLPAALLLQTPAANCAALRSGKYRVALVEEADAGSTASETFVFNAATLEVTNQDGSIDALTPIGTCRYSSPEGGEIVVSQAGVITFRGDGNNGVFHQGIAFPEQSIGVAALAGIWNGLGFERDQASSTPAYAANAGTVTFDAAGKLLALNHCADVKTCEQATGADLPAVTLTANAAGGFDFVNTTEQYTDRLFVYRTGGGELMAVLISGGGSFSVLTRARVNALPTVGAITRNWNQDVSAQLLANGLTYETGNTIVAADAATGQIDRTRVTGAGASYNEVLLVNQPRNGYTLRPAATPTASDGSTVNVREFTALPLRGSGLSVLSLPSLGLFEFSVAQPGGVGLPAALLSKPFAANCTALRSGTVRFVTAQASGSFATGTRTVDATTLQVKFADGSLERQFTANGPCRYSSTDGSELVVSQGGVAVFHVRADDGTQRVGVAFAEQAHTVAELAGTWTQIGFTRSDSGSFVPDAATLSVDATGTSTALSYCADLLTCAPVTGKTLAFAASADGGFIRTDSSDGSVVRSFAYRSGTGDLMLVQIGSDGSIGFLTPQRAFDLPAVGARTRSFDTLIGANLQANGGVGDTGTITVLSVDAAARTWLRSRTTASGASYTETLAASNPRDGYTFRAASTPTASDGTTVTVREFTAMGLKGMGVSPLSLPAIGSFDLSVQQP